MGKGPCASLNVRTSVWEQYQRALSWSDSKVDQRFLAVLLICFSTVHFSQPNKRKEFWVTRITTAKSSTHRNKVKRQLFLQPRLQRRLKYPVKCLALLLWANQSGCVHLCVWQAVFKAWYRIWLPGMENSFKNKKISNVAWWLRTSKDVWSLKL